MRGIGLLCVLALGAPGLVPAAGDSFLVSTLIGVGDVTPPSIPSNVAATPSSTDQIDVAWGASTDDFAVAGYQVFRDLVQVATTSLTSFSDTGLAADTLYSYSIRAFDTSNNVSAFSTSSATTTEISLLENEGSSAIGGFGPEIEERETDVIISNLSITTTQTKAIITFTANQPTQSLFRWGRTSSYEIGYSASQLFKTEHRIVITDLQPGLLYESELTLISQFTGDNLVQPLSFTTKAGADILAPENVMNFSAVAEADGVRLTWKNPADIDFSKVRIMSSDLFYPVDAADGNIVYEGSQQAFTDNRPTVDGMRYYTAFTYDASGNISSGAVTSIWLSESERDSFLATTTATTSSTAEQSQILATDVVFVQPDKQAQSFASEVQLIAGSVTKISIPYEALPEHLKAIVVYVRHPNDPNKVFSFLLKVNNDRTAYEALIGGLETLGQYETAIEVFDFKTNTMSRTVGTIVVVDKSFYQLGPEASAVAWWRWLLVLALFILLLLVLRQKWEINKYEGSPA